METIQSILPHVLVFAVLFGIPYYFFRQIKKSVAQKECMICHQLTRGRVAYKGSFVIEVFLWFFFIVPGLIYTLWRSSSREVVCSYCGNKYLKHLSTSEIREIKRVRKKAA